MNSKIKAIFLALFLLGIVFLSSAMADASVEVDGEYRLGLLAGYSVPVGDQDFKSLTKSYISGGGILSKEVTPNWALGVTFDFFDVKDNNKTQQEQRVQMWTFSAIYSFLSAENWTPYFELGLGAAQTYGPFSQLGLRASSGIEFFFGSDYSMRAGVQYHFIGKSSPQNAQVYMVTPGIMLSRFFGGKTRREIDRLKRLQEQESLQPEEELVEVKEDKQLDSDKDGIFDVNDQCPNTPKGVLVDIRGCARDSDQDGVTDSFDACPKTPIGVSVNPIGCPQVSKIKKIELELKVLFEVNSAKINESFTGNIEQIVEMLKEFPEIVAEIQGHTDSSGNYKHNKKLSLNRAESVRNMLVEQYGISIDSLNVRGFGPDQPIASNQTAEGRAKNRRVIMVFSTR